MRAEREPGGGGVLTLTMEPSGRDRRQQAILTLLYKLILGLGECF